MPFIPPEVIADAKQMDLLTYLQNYEPYELVWFSGNTYTTKTHDSLKISNGKWYWWSQGFGGKSAVDYLIKVKGLSFIEAVEQIVGQVSIMAPACSISKQIPKPQKLLLPEKSSNADRVTEYLFHRGIDLEIINFCVEQGLVFESLPKHNAVFVGYGAEHKARYAAYRGTGVERFMGDAAGSDKRFSFRLISNNSDTVHLFESAIDLLSYATLIKMNEQDWKKLNLLSLAGVYQPQKDISKSKVPKALEQFLEENDSINQVVFHLDNDYIGRMATKAIMAVLPNKYEKVNEPPPKGKDFNDFLCICLDLSMAKNQNERNDER